MPLTRVKPPALDRTLNYAANTFTANYITFGDGTTQTTAGAAVDAYARTQANTANTLAANSYIQANAAFIQANSANTLAANSYIQANAAFIQANSANTLAANSYIQANAAFIQANSANTLAANSYIQANAAFIQANSANTLAANSYIQANAAFIQANSANTLAANSYIQANAAFAKANTSGSGYLANSIIFANTTGYLSNVSNFNFYTSNNTLVTNNLRLTPGGGGQITFADGTTQTTAGGGGGGASSNSFSTILVSGQPNVIANTPTGILTLVAGSGMTITTVGTSNTITFASTGGFSGGTIPNQLIMSNTTPSISNGTGALIVTGGIGVTGNIYIGASSVLGYANNASNSVVYQIYNSTTNSLDTIFG
jgi:hypothetical protein